jgi:hypothetical protein
MTSVVVVADAGVITTPPIRASGNDGLTAQPTAIVTIGGVVGTIHPHPYAIPEYPVAIMDVAMVVIMVMVLHGIVFVAMILVAMVVVAVALIGIAAAVFWARVATINRATVI